MFLPELTIVLGFLRLRHCWFLLNPFHGVFSCSCLKSQLQREATKRGVGEENIVAFSFYVENLSCLTA